MIDQREQMHQNGPDELGARWTGGRPPGRRGKHQVEVGEGFDAVFDGLWKGWAGALSRLKKFRVLFSNAERVQLLNAIGGEFFGDIQQVLYVDMTLRLTRLTDPVGKGAKQNLTVRRLPDFFCSAPKLHDDLKQGVEDAVQATEFARDWRNRRISHSDLTLEIAPNAKPLAAFSLHRVQAALDSIHAILNTISKRIRSAEIKNDGSIPPNAIAFVDNASQLVEAVLYIDSVVDPSGSLPITDGASARAFLSKLGRKPTSEEVKQIFKLRNVARKCR